MANPYDWEYPDYGTQMPNPNDQSGGYDPGPNSQPGSGAPPGPAPSTPSGPCPNGEGRDANGNCYEPCPPGHARNVMSGVCVELFPGDDDPKSNGCGANQEWSEAQQKCVAKGSGSAGGGGGSKGPVSQPAPQKSPYDAALSQSIFDMISRMMSGQDAPFGPDTIAKLQAAALQSNKGQLAASEKALQRRVVSAGLSRTGVGPAAQRGLRSAADADLSSNFRTVALTAVQNNYNARVQGLKEAQNFLQSERANSLSQDQLTLAYARLKQEWATTQATFDQQWKLAQNGNEQAIIQLLLSLKGGA